MTKTDIGGGEENAQMTTRIEGGISVTVRRRTGIGAGRVLGPRLDPLLDIVVEDHTVGTGTETIDLGETSLEIEGVTMNAIVGGADHHGVGDTNSHE